MQILFFKNLMEKFTGGTVLFQHQKWIFCQITKGKFLIFEWKMRSVRDEDILKFPKNLTGVDIFFQA